MFNDKLSEKKYTKSGYVSATCPKCHGYGSDPMSIFSHVTCSKCNGDGTIVKEDARGEESATHHQREENDDNKVRDWLFS